MPGNRIRVGMNEILTPMSDKARVVFVRITKAAFVFRAGTSNNDLNRVNKIRFGGLRQ